MRAYIIRRLLLIIPTLILVSMIVFLLARFIPGDAIESLVAMTPGEGGLSHEEMVEQIRDELGLNAPIHIQYLRWLGILPEHEWGFNAEFDVGETSTKRVTDQTVSVRAEIENIGEAASDYQVSLMLDDTTLETRNITLQPDKTEAVAFLAASNPEGTYTIEAIAYSDFSGVLQGNLGESVVTGKSILGEILDKIPISIELGIIAIITGLLIAFPIGIYSAIRQDSIGDYVGRSIAILFMAVPGFWIATLLWVFPAKWWGWSPDPVYIPISENFIGNIRQFIIPGVLMGMVMSGVTMRMTRTMMLEVLRQDYIRTAWSKGLSERIVVIRHALKNAMIPVITLIGLQLPILIGGTVIMEQIFQLPGMGRYMIESLGQRDYSIISGVNIMMATVILLCNLLVDVTYGWLDPRIRYR